ncbi:MAG TPA: aldehyde dehydrogenase family protein, partial [Geminicoccaceae bacterium]|nr:aldehyde dehydrogenase family protein [Geminicoccaceae bacterium]
MDVHGNWIAGAWLAGGQSNRSINPSNTDEVVGEYAYADEGQVRDAIAAAKAAFPGWSRSGIQQRFDALDRIATEILARKEELGRLLAREEGKTLVEGIGEAARAGQIFKFFAGEVLRLRGEKLPSTRPGIEVEVLREPVGVVGLITPWNFPLAIPAWKIAPAIAFGNCVLFKPADLVPGCAWALAEIISRSGLPEGVFNLVMGRGSVVGEALVNSEDVNAISFTGSIDTGRRIAQTCVARLAKVQLEMGGKNPLVVLDDADLQNAVNCAVQGAYYSTGQRCTASSRLIVTKGIHDRFAAGVTEAIKGLVVGDAVDPATQIGPVVDQKQLDQDLHSIDVGRQEGATLAFGGERLNREKPGFYLQPALFTDTTNDMRINREEIFGP